MIKKIIPLGIPHRPDCIAIILYTRKGHLFSYNYVTSSFWDIFTTDGDLLNSAINSGRGIQIPRLQPLDHNMYGLL